MLAGIKNDLLEAGKDEGCITFQHLNELLPDQVKDPGAIEELFDFLGENNIEIVTQEESGKRKTLSGEEWTGKKSGDDDNVSDAIPDNEEHESEETTTTYLREMGQFDLLTPEEEAKYSKTIREGFDAIIEAIGDAFWIAFNLIFIWQATAFIGRLKPFVKAQTLGWEMRYVYLVLPIAFTLMTIRIIQVNYLKLVRGIDPADPDKVTVEAALELAEDEQRAFERSKH